MLYLPFALRLLITFLPPLVLILHSKQQHQQLHVIRHLVLGHHDTAFMPCLTDGAVPVEKAMTPFSDDDAGLIRSFGSTHHAFCNRILSI